MIGLKNPKKNGFATQAKYLEISLNNIFSKYTLVDGGPDESPKFIILWNTTWTLSTYSPTILDVVRSIELREKWLHLTASLLYKFWIMPTSNLI